MEKQASFEMVKVGGEDLAAAKVDGTVWVSVRRMCEALGLDESGQRQKLTDHDRSPWATTGVIPGVGADGRNREVFCLDLDSVPMWLATIDASRVRPEARGKVVLFQREAARVLRDHFFRRPAFAVPDDLEGALLLAADRERERKRLAAKVAELEPGAAFAAKVADSTNALPMGAVAKLFGMGRQTFFDRLRELGIIEQTSTRPYQEHLDAGRFVVVEGTHDTNTKGTQVHTVTRVTGKGQLYLAKRLGIAPSSLTPVEP